MSKYKVNNKRETLAKQYVREGRSLGKMNQYPQAIKALVKAHDLSSNVTIKIACLLEALSDAYKGKLLDDTEKIGGLLVFKYNAMAGFVVLLTSWWRVKEDVAFFEEKTEEFRTKYNAEFNGSERAEIALIHRLVNTVGERRYVEVYDVVIEWLKGRTFDQPLVEYALAFFEDIPQIDTTEKIYKQKSYEFKLWLRDNIDKIEYLHLYNNLYEEGYEVETFIRETYGAFKRVLNGKLKLSDEVLSGLAHNLVTKDTYYASLSDEEYKEALGVYVKSSDTKKSFSHEICTNYFRKIKLGIMSYDFFGHSVMKYMTSLFLNVPQNSGLHVICYYTREKRDSFTTFFENRGPFKHVWDLNDEELMDVLYEDQLDIFMDLQGSSMGLKWFLKHYRLAPVQVFYLGMPMSTGNINNDYYLTDEFLDPKDGDTAQFMIEKPLYMYPTSQCFEFPHGKMPNPEPPCVRNGYFTFGNMSNPSKYSADTLTLWKMVLDRVPNSILLIQLAHYPEEYFLDKLKARLERFGLDMNRVKFNDEYGTDNYYKMYSEHMDCMLDTVDFAGSTTTLESMYMGVPVIVFKSKKRWGRMGYEIVGSTGGLDNLIASTFEEYAEKAYEISQQPEKLRWYREHWRDELTEKAPGFNSENFRISFEAAMRTAYLTYAYKHKKPFDESVYENDFETLMRDSLRAEDIIMDEIEHNDSGVPIDELIAEYIKMMKLVLEKLLDMYEDQPSALELLQKMINLFELLIRAKTTDDVERILKSLKVLHVKFA